MIVAYSCLHIAWGSNYIYILPHSALSWNLSSAEIWKSQLSRWATKWHYYQSQSQPASQPASQPPTHPASRLFSPTLLKVKYLSNHLSDHPQILNLSLFDQTKLHKWRQPPMEDDLKYQIKISQQPLLVGSPQIFQLKFKWSNQTIQIYQMKTNFDGRCHPMEDDLKYQKKNISATNGQIIHKF